MRDLFLCAGLLSLLLLLQTPGRAQITLKNSGELDFVSDTQQPLGIEKIRLPSNHNALATSRIFHQLIISHPACIFMLGDIVGLGSSNRKWRMVDAFLDSCRQQRILVHGLLGNHDVMWTKKKGELNFSRRFPEDNRLGYTFVLDSIAIVMLNSNFKKLTSRESAVQTSWYQAELPRLNKNDAVKCIIVCCHHAPYSNSLMVGSSKSVQQNFVPAFLQTAKCKLFITGHAHAFEHFMVDGKDFLTIGGGGGLHQPLDSSAKRIPDLAGDYKPMFHFLSLQPRDGNLILTSHFLKPDFSGFQNGYSFEIKE